jgi:hypothetical protein
VRSVIWSLKIFLSLTVYFHPFRLVILTRILGNLASINNSIFTFIHLFIAVVLRLGLTI